jgi:hypothetical protein
MQFLTQGPGASLQRTTEAIDQFTDNAIAQGEYGKAAIGVASGVATRLLTVPFYAGQFVFGAPWNAAQDFAQPFGEVLANDGNWSKFNRVQSLVGLEQLALIGLGAKVPVPNAATALGRVAQAAGAGGWFGSAFDITEQQRAIGAGEQADFNFGQNLRATTLGGVLGGGLQAGGDAPQLMSELKPYADDLNRAVSKLGNSLNSGPNLFGAGSIKQRFPDAGGGAAKGAAAIERANAAQAAGRTRGAAAELRVGQQVFTDVSTGGPRTLHPDVVDALEAVPPSQRAPWHGKCAEPGCLSQALNAGVDPAGGTSTAVNIRGPGNPQHGTFKAACPSCAAVLKRFGVKF